MSNLTRQEIINAHEALSSLNHLADNYISFVLGGGDETKELCQTILAALPPRPQTTMAEVEWDDDKHYLAEAEHPAQGRVIMLFQSPNTGNIFFMYPNGGVQHVVYCRPCNLTPTGKRYALTEVQE